MIVELVAAAAVGWAIGKLSQSAANTQVAPGHILNGPAVASRYTAYEFAKLPPAERRHYMIARLGSVPSITPTMGTYTPGEAEALLQGGLVGLNLYQLRKGIPGISRALHGRQVRYEGADPNERWKSLREIWEEPGKDGMPFEDCEGLAAAVAAERIFKGRPSQIVLHRVHDKLSHVVVQDLATGTLHDPSRTGGMGGKG